MLRYLIGLVVMLMALGATSYGVHALRRALLPRWAGAPGVLVDILTVLATIVVVTQVLGALAIYHIVPVTIAYVAIGAGLHRAAARLTGTGDIALADAPASRLGRPGNALAAVTVAVGLGPWITRAAVGFTGGVPGADTTWYHLPTAAKLVQTGSLQDIQYYDGGALVPYYPIASTFFHATGMLFLESDILSPLVNLGWACLALLACWLLGRPFGVSAATIVAGTVVLSFPGFVGHNGGSAMNDVVTLTLVLSAVALLVNADRDRLTTALPVIALAGMMTGMALGTKWTAIPSTGALTAAVLVAARAGHRIRSGATWLAASAATGLFTYIRNLVIVGNPLPPRDLAVGPIRFDGVHDDENVSSIFSWLRDGGAWDEVFRPGLNVWFGPLWPLALLLMVTGLLLGVVRGPGRPMRIGAFTGLVALAGYLFMPQALEFLGQPLYFLSGLRYGSTALALGFVLLAVAPIARGRRAVWATPTLLAILLLSTTTAGGTWTGVDDWRFQEYVGTDDTIVGLVAALIIGLTGLALVARPELIRGRLPLVVGTGLVVAMLVSVATFSTYTDERYAEPPFWSAAVDLTDARIALYGQNTQFMFYGPDLSNHVQYVGRVEDGVISPPASCEDWVSLVNEGDFTHIVIGPLGVDRPGPYLWSVNDPGATIVQDIEGRLTSFTEATEGNLVGLFRLDADLDASRCAT